MRSFYFVRGSNWAAIFKPHFYDEAELMEARIAVEKVTGIKPTVRVEWAQVNCPMMGQPLHQTTLELRAFAYHVFLALMTFAV